MAKRRANGEGSIRKRQDGRWEGRYTAGYDPKTGKPIYKSVLAKPQGEVKEKLRTAIEHARQVDVVKSGKYTFGQWMDLWYESFCVIHVRPSSHQTYRGYIKNHIKPHLGRVKLEALTTLQLQRFYSKLLASGRVDRIEAANQPKGLSPKTVRNIHNVIHEALNKAVMEKLIPTNPADGCMLPRVEHKEMKTLDLTQLDQFFQEARNSGVFEQYYTELATGLRRGELLGLKWTDINYEARTISIRRQIQRLEGGGPGGAAEDEERLPEHCCQPRTAGHPEGKAGGRKRTLPVCVLLPNRRPHFAGQCTAYAAQGTASCRSGTAALP